VGTDTEWNQRAVQIATEAGEDMQNKVRVHASIGIHPGEVSFGNITSSTEIDKQIAILTDLLLKHREWIVAIGECGIDAHYSGYEIHKTLQQELFRHQCALAQKYTLPLIIHSREQFTDTLEVLQEFPQLALYFHCRGYTAREIQQVLSLPNKVWVGFCGNITYPKASDIQESLVSLREHSPESLLLETDAPYLTPQTNRGETNTPTNIIHIYSYVSEILDIPMEDLQKTIAQNNQALYQRD